MRIVSSLVFLPAGGSAGGSRLARRRRRRALTGALSLVAALLGDVLAGAGPVGAEVGRVPGGGMLRVTVPEAFGGKTVVGQLTVDQVLGAGFVTAFGCDGGLPMAADRSVSRSDLNFDGDASPVASNRLIVEADDDGEVCFYTSQPAALIVDVNAVTFDTGVTSFTNRRTDTRDWPAPVQDAGGVVRVAVPEAVGGRTVVGQLTVDRVVGAGFVTAFGCDGGLPMAADGSVSRSDLNFDGAVTPVASNRLIVQADRDGEVCFYTSQRAALVVDVNGVSDTGITSFPNRRTDTRTSGTTGGTGTVTVDGVPVWETYDPLPAVSGVAALTGLAADATVTGRPILAVKIDNYGPARPQWGLEHADVIIEENVEGITRFVALFHSGLPETIGPVRSARTGDLDLLSPLNRAVFAYSGANPGVTDWIESAAGSGVLVDFSAQHSPCYSRSPDRPGPHNLLLEPTCALATATAAGPARPLWQIDPAWSAPPAVAGVADTAFAVAMDGVDIEWTWDPGHAAYLRSQDGQPHLTVSGARIAAHNVVEIASEHIASPVDQRSPNPVTVGSGIAVVHRDGMAIPAIWTRASAYSPFQFRDPATNAAIPLDTGTTFVELERA